MSEWDDWERETEAGDLPALAEKAWNAEKEFEKAKKVFDEACAAIAAKAPEYAGDHDLSVGDWRITVTRPQSLSWDQETLRSIYGEDGEGLPPFIEKKIVVNKRAFESASPADQAALGPALEVKVGKAKVKVSRTGGAA